MKYMFYTNSISSCRWKIIPCLINLQQILYQLDYNKQNTLVLLQH